jgi:hypothetical protein
VAALKQQRRAGASRTVPAAVVFQPAHYTNAWFAASLAQFYNKHAREHIETQ